MTETMWTFTVLFASILVVLLAFAGIWLSQHRHL